MKNSQQSLKQDRQNERLRFIDLCAYSLGYVSRKLLMQRFEIKDTWASKDIQEYLAVCKNQLIYSHQARAYQTVDCFEPVFEHSFTDAYLLAAEGIQKLNCVSDVLEQAQQANIKSIDSDLLSIAAVLRAVNRKTSVEIEYISRSSGRSQRLIMPHTIFSAGNFKYVRAFDNKTGQFRSFKLNRIVQSHFSSLKPEEHMLLNVDADWNHELTLKLVVNKLARDKEAIEFDYGLTNGELVIQIRKALLPFFLMDWNIAPKDNEVLPATLFPLEVKDIQE